MSLKSIVLGLMILPVSASAAELCTTKDIQSARMRPDAILFPTTSWSALHRSYSEFKQCDDGAMAEGYSDAVVQLLANHWAGLRQLLAISSRDPAFLQFVLRHIDATTDDHDLEKILINASKRCLVADHSLCSAIESAAKVALQETGPKK